MPQTLYHNGTVLTADDTDQAAGAVLTEGERILAIGAACATYALHLIV